MSNQTFNPHKLRTSQWYAWDLMKNNLFLVEVKGDAQKPISILTYDSNQWYRNGESWIREQIPFESTYLKREVINIIRDSSEKVDEREFDSSPDLIAFRNYTVDFLTCSLIPHNPDHLITRAFDFDININLPSPYFQQVLDWFYPKPSHDLIEEFMYYVISNNGKFRGPILSIDGSTKTAKSLLGRLLNVFLHSNSAFPNMDQICGYEGGYLENFIADKRLCVLDEDVVSDLKPLKPWLKRMTGGNPSTSRQVGTAVNTSDEVQVPFIITTNKRPKDNEHKSFTKEDEAFYNRVLCIDTIDNCPILINKRTKDWERKNLLDNPMELAGIISRLLKAGQRLQQRGHFDDGLTEIDRWKKFK